MRANDSTTIRIGHKFKKRGSFKMKTHSILPKKMRYFDLLTMKKSFEVGERWQKKQRISLVVSEKLKFTFLLFGRRLLSIG